MKSGVRRVKGSLEAPGRLSGRLGLLVFAGPGGTGSRMGTCRRFAGPLRGLNLVLAPGARGGGEAECHDGRALHHVPFLAATAHGRARRAVAAVWPMRSGVLPTGRGDCSADAAWAALLGASTQPAHQRAAAVILISACGGVGGCLAGFGSPPPPGGHDRRGVRRGQAEALALVSGQCSTRLPSSPRS